MLPILESLTNGQTKASRKTGYGRTPSVLVLLPTRELACQVCCAWTSFGACDFRVHIIFFFNEECCALGAY